MSKKRICFYMSIFTLLALPITSMAFTPSCGEVTGLWNFDNADFAATTGNNLVMVGNQNLNQFDAFGFIPNIAGTTPHSLRAFAYGPGDYLQMFPGIEANGGGSYVNQYTLMFDLLYAERLSLPAALYQTNANNANAVECLLSTVEGNDGLGFDGQYDGDVEPLVWYRIGIVVDCVANTMSKYIDGALVGTQTLDGVDGRWSLNTATQNLPTLLLTSPNNMQETRELYLNSIAISVDLVDAKMDKYINGVLVGSQVLPSGLDGRWSIYPAADEVPLILFADNDDETAPAYVNSVSIVSCPLTAGEVATFGGPSAAGIGEYSPTAVGEWALY